MNWKFWKHENKEKVEVFPCASDNCLVRMTCSKPCEKIEMDDNKVMELFLKHKACIDCGCEDLIEGPSGGAATNVKCAGCGHWFNLGLPLFIQRIHISKEQFYE